MKATSREALKRYERGILFNTNLDLSGSAFVIQCLGTLERIIQCPTHRSVLKSRPSNQFNQDEFNPGSRSYLSSSEVSSKCRFQKVVLVLSPVLPTL